MPTVIYAFCAIGIILQAVFIVREHKKKYVSAVILKGLASLMFVFIGYLGYSLTSDTLYTKMILLGLCFGALGDVLLNLRFLSEKNGQKIFLIGILAFLIGHILYLVALIPQSDHLVASLIIGVVLAAALLIFIFCKLNVKPAFKVFGVFYIGAVVLMTTVAVGNLISAPSKNRLLYAIGAVLFTISDIVLIFNTFGKKSKFSLRITNLAFYYAGQLLIALSLFFI
ncbi:MAG: lysoplasmalogenase [Lachnospiraceae bacterium]|nr:lysoplasmalogenase [Lachnospiraceae bacterium]